MCNIGSYKIYVCAAVAAFLSIYINSYSYCVYHICLCALIGLVALKSKRAALILGALLIYAGLDYSLLLLSYYNDGEFSV